MCITEINKNNYLTISHINRVKSQSHTVILTGTAEHLLNPDDNTKLGTEGSNINISKNQVEKSQGGLEFTVNDFHITN